MRKNPKKSAKKGRFFLENEKSASDIQTLMVTATKYSRVSLTKWNENI